MELILTDIRIRLLTLADIKTKESGERFFKESVILYGVKSTDVEKLAKQTFREIKNRPKSEILDLCTDLWQSGYMEESFIACHWSYELHTQYLPEDFLVFETWVTKYVSNWASCDTLCNHTIGTFVEMYPEFVEKIKTWAHSKNRWVRRASAVTFIIPARHGKFLSDICEIADTLLLDTDDLVQKGYGWMLKAASQAHQKEVFEYVMKKKSVMPRTALRYTIEKMPIELKKQAMMK